MTRIVAILPVFLTAIFTVLLFYFAVPAVTRAMTVLSVAFPAPFQNDPPLTAVFFGTLLGLLFATLLRPGQTAAILHKARSTIQPLQPEIRHRQSMTSAAITQRAQRVPGRARVFMSEVPIGRGDLPSIVSGSRTRFGKGTIGGLKARARSLLNAVGSSSKITNLLENIKVYSGLLDRYSASNAALIYWQDPNATLVHSEKDWKRLSRKLNKDPQALAVLVPIGGGRKVSQPEVARLIERRRKMGWNDARISSEVNSLLARGNYVPTKTFGVGRVYDAKSLAPGRPLPRKTADKVSKVYSMAKNYARRFYDVKEGPITGARGYSNLARREDGTIRGQIQVLKVPGEQVQPLDTLVHEMAHHQLGHTRDLSTREYKANRGKYEAETQLTSFLVLSHFGINNKQHSSAYIGQWLSGQEQKTLGEQSVARSMNAANKLIQGMEAERTNIEGPKG